MISTSKHPLLPDRSVSWCLWSPLLVLIVICLTSALIKMKKEVGSPSSGTLKAIKEDDVFVFSSSGVLISTIRGMAKDAALIDWTQSEDLIRVAKDGHINLYDMMGTVKNDFSLEHELKDNNIVLEARIFHSKKSSGIAILTSNFKYLVVDNVKDPSIKRLVDIPGLSSLPTSWAVVVSTSSNPFASGSEETYILLAVESVLFLLNVSEKTYQIISAEFSQQVQSIHQMAIGLNSSNVALLADTGHLWMGHLEKGQLVKKSEFNTKSKVTANFLMWAGTHAVVGLWRNAFVAIDFEKNYFNFSLETPVHLVQEMDGVRFISNDNHELLQHIPQVIIDIHKIGALSAGTILVEASKEFNRKSYKAGEWIEMLRDRDEMETSVQMAIEAAAHEFQPSDQKVLLRAASFGKSFSPQANRDNFVNMCQMIRILNNIRLPTVGMPLSYIQLEYLTPHVLLDRLVIRKQYAMAMKIADYLKIPETEGSLRILSNWASKKVHESDILDDDQVAALIYTRLGHKTGISYSEIASEAVRRGRKNLAIKLLDHETRAGHQVPLLLTLEQYNMALEKAVFSGDTHLILSVIHRLKQKISSREFTFMIRNHEMAYHLYQKLCREEDPDRLKQIYSQEEDFMSEGFCWIQDSYQESTRQDERKSCLQHAVNCFKKSKSTSSDINGQLTEEQLRLFTLQVRFEKSHILCLDLSVHETLEKLLMAKEYKVADDLKKEFKVPDKRYYFLRINILAEMGEWLELEKFSKSRKPPVGFEPFVDACLTQNNRYEAMKYVNKVDDENKIKYLVKVGLLQEAGEFAFEQKDENGLNYVISKSGPHQRSKIEPLRQLLLQKR